MKKKFLLTLLALVCALGCAFSLAACGDGGKVKISVEQFTDAGVEEIAVAGIPSGTSTSEDFDEAITRQKGELYTTVLSTNNFQPTFYTAKFNKGKWDVCVEIQINELAYTVGTLKIEVGGEEKDFTISTTIDNVILAKFFDLSPSGNRYYAFIENVSSDTQIKIKGNTTIKNYTPEITLGDYDENNDLHNELVFKYSKNGGAFSEELSIQELKNAIEVECTYNDSYDIITYFKGKNKFFVNEEVAELFIGFVPLPETAVFDTASKELKWKIERTEETLYSDLYSSYYLHYEVLAEGVA